MKKAVLYFALMVCCQQVHSQVGTYSTINTSKLYWLIENPVRVVYQNMSCKEIMVDAINCKIVKTDCDFMVYPEVLGEITFAVSKGGTVIDSFKIWSYPLPMSEVSKTITGHPVPSAIKISNSVLEEYGYQLSIDSMYIEAFRNDTLLFGKTIAGNNPWRCGDTDLNSLLPGSTYTISKVKVKRIDPHQNILFYWDFVYYKGTL